MFVIDFDDTLFNTQAFKEARKSALENIGIPEDIFKISYRAAYRDSSGKNVYSNKTHAEALEALGFNKDKVFNALEETTKDLSVFLFPDTVQFLEKMKEFNETMILLSLGEINHIGMKVSGSGVDAYFNQVIIVDDTKGHVIGRLLNESVENEVVLVNDKIQESLDLLSTFPQLKIVLKKSPLWSVEEYDNSGLPYFKTLMEIYEFIKSTK